MKTATATLLALSCSALLAHADWARFRGPNGTGVSDAKNLPSSFDDASTVWKVEVGKGWSSPVIWKDMVIVTSEGDEGKRAVIALSTRDGKELWRHEEKFATHRKHDFNSFASSTPFIDDARIYVNWSSGTDVQALALDHKGKLLWRNDHVADYIHEHGTGASALVADGIMLVRSEFATEKQGKSLTTDPKQESWKSCFVGLDAATGKQAWKHELPNCLNTYSTPVIRELPGGKREFVCSNTGSGVMGIDTKTGKLNWQHNPGFTQRSLGSAAFVGGRYFTTFGSGGGGKETASLDLSGEKPKPVELGVSKSLPYVPSPLVVGDLMYLLGDGGILTCVEFKTGKTLYSERLEGVKGSSKFFSSPVAGDGKIYCGSQQNDVIVIKAGPTFQRLSATKLDSAINATPAISADRVFVRTANMLWCAGAKQGGLP